MSDATEFDVGFTSKVMAASRAIETERVDALFTDPFARQLAGEETIQAALPLLDEDEQQGRPFAPVRTRFFDDFLTQTAHNSRQVVLLGAGMDTRAFRMNWAPETQLYEIDQSHVLNYKEAALAGVQPNCNRHSICADLTESLWPERLLKKGYQPSEPSIWLLEGLLYYLSTQDVDRLLKQIENLAAAGSWLGADVINTAILNGSEPWAKHWRFGCDQPESFFANYGWQATAVQPGEAGATFGRFTNPFCDRNITDAPHKFFVVASRHK